MKDTETEKKEDGTSKNGEFVAVSVCRERNGIHPFHSHLELLKGRFEICQERERGQNQRENKQNKIPLCFSIIWKCCIQTNLWWNGETLIDSRVVRQCD